MPSQHISQLRMGNSAKECLHEQFSEPTRGQIFHYVPIADRSVYPCNGCHRGKNPESLPGRTRWFPKRMTHTALDTLPYDNDKKFTSQTEGNLQLTRPHVTRYGEAERNPLITGLPDDHPAEDRPGCHTRSSAANISINRKPVATSTYSLESEDSKRFLIHSSVTGEVPEGTTISLEVKPLWNIWAWEVTYILLSISAFLTIIVVLNNYDQQPLPDWPSSITLNTFLAFFTTLSKAAFMLPVSVAISQAQWGWLLKDRPLYDLHIFDQASRGPWGSMMLLWRVRYKHFVAIGALLMIVSAVTSPITQLAINYPVRDAVALGEEARAPAVRTIVSPADRLDVGFRRALVLATLSDSTGLREPITPLGAFCSTGNCTFDQYQSLGVCMKMVNITSHLRVEEFTSPELIDTLVLGFPNPQAKVWRASLPGGFEMAHQTPMAAMVDMLNGQASFAFGSDESLKQTRIASFVLMHTIPTAFDAALWGQLNTSTSAPMTAEVIDAIRGFRHEAVEVFFHLCVQTYDTKIQMGLETTRVMESFAEPVEGEDPFYLDMNCRPLLKQASRTCNQSIDRWNETLHLKSPASRTMAKLNTTHKEDFSVSLRSLEKMATTMKIDLVGYASASYVTEQYQDTAIFFRGTEFIKTLFQDVLFSMNTMANHSLHHTFMNNLYENIATSLSTSMRSGEPQRYSVSAFNITGQAWTQVSYVHITWGWISMLAIEIALAMLFLVITIASQGFLDGSRGSGKEDRLSFRDAKNSHLATLVALSEATRAKAGGGLQPVNELESIAKGLRVRFQGKQIVVTEGIIAEPSRKT